MKHEFIARGRWMNLAPVRRTTGQNQHRARETTMSISAYRQTNQTRHSSRKRPSDISCSRGNEFPESQRPTPHFACPGRSLWMEKAQLLIPTRDLRLMVVFEPCVCLREPLRRSPPKDESRPATDRPALICNADSLRRFK